MMIKICRHFVLLLILLFVCPSVSMIPSHRANIKAYLKDVNPLYLETEHSSYRLVPEENVLVIHHAKSQTTKTVSVGQFPICLALSTHFVYVLNYDSSTVTVINRKTKAVDTTFSVPNGAHIIKLSEGKFGYVLNARTELMIFDRYKNKMLSIFSFEGPLEYFEVVGSSLYLIHKGTDAFKVDVYPPSGNASERQSLKVPGSLMKLSVYKGTLCVLTSLPGQPNALYTLCGTKLSLLSEVNLFGQLTVSPLKGIPFAIIVGYREPKVCLIDIYNPLNKWTFELNGVLDHLLCLDGHLYICSRINDEQGSSYMVYKGKMQQDEQTFRVRPLLTERLVLKSLDQFFISGDVLYIESKQDRRIYALSSDHGVIDTLIYSGQEGKLRVSKGSFYLNGHRIHPYLTMSGHLRKISQESSENVTNGDVGFQAPAKVWQGS